MWSIESIVGWSLTALLVAVLITTWMVGYGSGLRSYGGCHTVNTVFVNHRSTVRTFLSCDQHRGD